MIMRKQLSLLFLLLLSVQLAIAQTSRYEYWFDNDHQGRTIVANATPDIVLDLDISSLKSGIHYFNVRAQGQSDEWGGLSRYIFFIRNMADITTSSMAGYEYWLDNQYDARTTVSGEASEYVLNLDISNLKPGIHYFNYRVQDKSGQWGGLSRYIFYINEVNGMSQLSSIEYWIDSRQNTMTQQVTGKDMAITVDISNLPKGTHTFYMEGVANDGSRSMLNAYEFEVEAGDVEPYAVLSENNTVLTFYCDDQKATRNGMGIGPFVNTDSREWKDDVTTITSVEFDPSFANCTSITSTARWFDGCSNLTSISGINNLYTANVTSMRRMFRDCSSLTSIDLSHFNTENVTNMEYMFDGCSGLTILDVSGFNTENVTNMGSMFASCSGLTTLDVTDFNTANVTDISRMFYSCSGLTTLDLSNFNTANAKEDLRHLFMNCFSLKTIYAGSGWTTDATTKGDEMFMNCTSLVGGAGTVYVHQSLLIPNRTLYSARITLS